MAAVLGCPEVELVKWNRTTGPPNLRVDADVTVSFGRHVCVLAAGTQGQVFAVVTCFLVRNAMLARIPEFFNKQSENYFETQERTYQRREGEGRLDLAEK